RGGGDQHAAAGDVGVRADGRRGREPAAGVRRRAGRHPGQGHRRARPQGKAAGDLMGTLKVTFVVKPLGPLADGSAPAIVHAWADEVKKEIAQEGVNRLRAFTMDRSGRATGRYQSEIQTSTLAFGDIRIHDPVVYGPWLEG